MIKKKKNNILIKKNINKYIYIFFYIRYSYYPEYIYYIYFLVTRNSFFYIYEIKNYRCNGYKHNIVYLFIYVCLFVCLYLCV